MLQPLDTITSKLLYAKWWKYLAIILLIYTIIAGFLVPVPRLHILNETIRNLYFHVTMWFGMLLTLLLSLIYSIIYLRTNNLKYDIIAEEAVKIAAFFGILGLITGMIWAQYTWGYWWNNDPRQTSAAVAVLIYFAYLILKNSMIDPEKSAKIGAVYNIFAFFAFLSLLYIVPRIADSLHPGSGGNSALGEFDLDSRMRMVFYPAILGWTFLGLWMASIRIRMRFIEEYLRFSENN